MYQNTQGKVIGAPVLLVESVSNCKQNYQDLKDFLRKTSS